jgi:hypothetical protein
MTLQIQRIVITFNREGIEIRTLYRTRNQDGPGPNSKARRREVEELSREGLRQALASFEGGAECIGTSGFTTREDTFSLPLPDELREAAGRTVYLESLSQG